MSEQDSLQLIDESKEFSKDILPYFKQCLSNRDIDQNYHVISVFGSQSSGKSTLLNILFNTCFDTMDAQKKRQQTTKGIWLAHTNQVNTSKATKTDTSDIFVLDVEGSDGMERGEDQDFERKAALFAIAVSEILIVNLWEQQIGLYQGNNMGLLKTVFEVNLSLFGNSKLKNKVLLLFTIRDHVGVTPMDSLSKTLITELEKLWDQLNKPIGTENYSLYDFFDLKFVGLGHKLLQNEKFVNDVKTLGDSLTMADGDDYYFKPEYHHDLPLDGWCMYAENCWDQIEHNKDLDLPTQQILVARFKTNEILNESITNHFKDFDSISKKVLNNRSKLIELLTTIKNNCVEEYDGLASRYSKAVYLENREVLNDKLNKLFLDVIETHLNTLSTELLSNLQIASKSRDNTETTFIERLNITKADAIEQYSKAIGEFTKANLISAEDERIEHFNKEISEKLSELTDVEVKSLVARAKKNITFELKDSLVSLLNNADASVWDKILDSFEKIIGSNLERYKTDDNKYDFQVGYTPAENEKTYKHIRSNAWITLGESVRDYLKPDTIVSILRDRFENSFRYDESDAPILWKNEEQIDSAFRLAKEHALEIFNVFCLAKTSDNVEIIPDVSFNEEEYEDQDGIFHIERFAHILNESGREKVLKQFKRQINITVIDAKRSIITTTTHIPIWIYGLIVVLGWNEFMMVIKNPLFVTLILLGSVAFYFIHKFDLWGPVINVAQSAVGETKSTIKNKLRTYVLDEHEYKNEKITQQIDDDKTD